MGLSKEYSITNPEDLHARHEQMLDALVQAGKWSDIVPGMFPTVFKPTVEFAKEQAFDVRTSYIGAQMNQLSEIMDLFPDDDKVQGLINGRMIELKDELSNILQARFPDTKPVKPPEAKEAAVLLNRDVNAAIQFLVSQGEIDALSVENIPALKYLKPETLIELKIDALLAKLFKLETWQTTEMYGEKHGFPTTQGDRKKSNLDRLAEREMQKTVSEIEALSQERLDLLDLH